MSGEFGGAAHVLSPRVNRHEVARIHAIFNRLLFVPETP